MYSEASVQRLKTILKLRTHRLHAELDQMLGAIHDLKGAPLDTRARAILNALAIKGMALAQHLLLLLNREETPPL